MITRHHIALTLLCTLILVSALVPSDPVLIAVICAGAIAGAILPDIQMKKPKRTGFMTAGWLVSRFSSVVFAPLICRLYRGIWGRTCDKADKRLTHSVPGILFLWITCTAFLAVPAFFVTGSILHAPAAAFLCGLMLGMILHLAEDMCTRKGITPLFPFSTAMVSGSIRPCDTTDRRIGQFHFYHCSVAGIIIGFQYFEGLQGAVSMPVCIFGLLSCLAMMIWSSDVIITREPVEFPAGVTPMHFLTDPFIRMWRAEHPSPGLMMGVYYLRDPLR